MEKIMLNLWRPADRDAEQWRDALIGLRDGLTDLGARRIRVMVADEDVAKAAGQCVVNVADPFHGMLTLWLDSASMLPPVQELVQTQVRRLDAYLVVESEPYPEIRQARIEHFGVDFTIGQRVQGMCQIALLRKPEWLDYEEWHTIWRRDHGPQAYPLQSSFGYRQNTVVRPLTPDAADCQAIVEEHFPDQAVGSREGFFAMDADAAVAARNMKAMGASTSRFLEQKQTTAIQTSYYPLTD